MQHVQAGHAGEAEDQGLGYGLGVMIRGIPSNSHNHQRDADGEHFQQDMHREVVGRTGSEDGNRRQAQGHGHQYQGQGAGAQRQTAVVQIERLQGVIRGRC